jgi:hypothetical protein
VGVAELDTASTATDKDLNGGPESVERNRPLLAVVAAAFVALLTPIGTIAPLPTGDNSWHASLAMAFNQGIQFGPSAIFSYGPLGFLEFPQLYYTTTFDLAVLYVTATHLIFCAALYWTLSRTFGKAWGLVAAVIGTWIVAAALLATPAGVSPASPGLIFVGGSTLIWCVALVRGELSDTTSKLIPYVLGAGTALLLLIEANMALSVGVLSLVSVLMATGPRLRRPLAFLATFSASLVLLWMVDGQGVTHLWSYLYGSFQITSGYAAALAVEDAPAWQYVAAAALVAIVGIVLYYSSQRPTLQRTWAPMALVAVFLFFTFKETFVVHGPGHRTVAFAACFVALLAMPVISTTRIPLIGALGLTLLSLIAVNGLGTTLSTWRSGVANSVRVPVTLVSSGRQMTIMQTVRKQIHDGYYPGLALTPTAVAQSRGRATYIQDGESGVSWAYPTIPWRPLPVLQDFMAYTPYLDQLNADFVASRERPDRILRPPSTGYIGTLPSFETPATVLAMICHYVQLSAQASWQVLGRHPNRCGPLHPVSVVRAKMGQTIEVPRPTQPEEAIVARIYGIPSSLTRRSTTVLFKSSTYEMRVNGSSTAYRFVETTAGQPHLIIEPDDLGYACPFAYAPIRSFSINGGGTSSGTSGLRVSFFSMRVTPAGSVFFSCNRAPH